MRSLLRGASKTRVTFCLGVVFVLCAGCGASAFRLAHFDPAQANLRTALKGAAVFYSSNSDSYEGIDGGEHLSSAVPSIADLDTGLTYVSGHTASPNSDIISVYAPSRSVLVLTAYMPGLQTCWGILSLRASRANPYFSAFPSTSTSGTFYFTKASSAPKCSAATSHSPSALSTRGFPAL